MAQTSLLESLRESTSALHHAMHHHPLLEACQQRRLNENGYKCILKAFYAPWKMLLPVIEDAPIDSLKYALTRRAHALQSDLVELNVDLECLSQPTSFITDKDEFIGASYVLVGSSLGAITLAGDIRATLGDLPTAYLSISPRDAGWPALLSYLRTSQVKSELAACSAAQNIFQLIDQELSADDIEYDHCIVDNLGIS